MDEQILEVCRSLIYMGRYFRPSNDEIVLKKSVEYLEVLMERRSYRPPQEAKPEAPAEEAAPTPEPAPSPQQSDGKSKFINITGLFPSKSGKADTVFVDEAMVEKLASIQPGDLLGISENQKTQRLQLWFVPKEDN